MTLVSRWFAVHPNQLAPKATCSLLKLEVWLERRTSVLIYFMCHKVYKYVVAMCQTVAAVF
jgi:hypothetical protein